MLYSIAPVLAVTAGDKSKTYGDVNPLLTYTLNSGLIDGDTSDTALAGLLSTIATETSDVGTPAITEGTLFSPLGYQIDFAPGSLLITPKDLTIVADNKLKTYGKTNPLFTGVVSGLTNGDSETDIGVDYLTPATLTSGAGKYNITPTITSANYNLAFIGGELTIVPVVPDKIKTVDTSFPLKQMSSDKAYNQVDTDLTNLKEDLNNNFSSFSTNISIMKNPTNLNKNLIENKKKKKYSP
jgi:hypothetical protein